MQSILTLLFFHMDEVPCSDYLIYDLGEKRRSGYSLLLFRLKQGREKFPPIGEWTGFIKFFLNLT